MYIHPRERPQEVGYKMDYDMFSAEDLPICLHCKYSSVNTAFPKDEFWCQKTSGICNALCTCDKFEENC